MSTDYFRDLSRYSSKNGNGEINDGKKKKEQVKDLWLCWFLLSVFF